MSIHATTYDPRDAALQNPRSSFGTLTRQYVLQVNYINNIPEVMKGTMDNTAGEIFENIQWLINYNLARPITRPSP